MALDMGSISMAGDGGLNDIVLEMETLDDTFEKSIARYEYPFSDGADLEDMGQKAHSVKVRCYFWDNGNQATYNAHIQLINLLAIKDLLEFNHPQYGIMLGKVESVTVRHDDRKRTAQVDFSFVEQMRTSIAPVPNVGAFIESSFLDSQDEQLAALDDDLKVPGLDIIVEFDPTLPVLPQYKGLTGWLRDLVRELDGYLGQFDALENQVMQPVNSLIATVNYGANLPGRILGTITRAVERVATLYASLRNFPARFTANLSIAFQQLVNATESFSSNQHKGGQAARTVIVKHLRIACAQRFALEAAYSYAADETNRQALRTAEQTPSFNVSGNYVSTPPDAQVATSQDLDASLVDVRSWIEETISDYRSMNALKTMAKELLTFVYTVKLESELIITVQIDNPLPVHLICLRFGLPYNYAERILAINSISNPNMISGALRIYTIPGGVA